MLEATAAEMHLRAMLDRGFEPLPWRVIREEIRQEWRAKAAAALAEGAPSSE